MQEELEWYLDRICYYKGITQDSVNKTHLDERRYKLYGNLEEYTSLENIKNMPDFWISGLSLFVKGEIKRKVKNETNKLRKNLEEKENKIRELAELIK